MVIIPCPRQKRKGILSMGKNVSDFGMTFEGIDLRADVEELAEASAQLEELQETIAMLKERIRTCLRLRGTTALRVGDYEVHDVPVTRRVLNQKLLRAELPDIAEQYTTESTYNRFNLFLVMQD